MAEGTRAGRATLARGERLRSAEEFQHLFDRGARVERESFILLWMVTSGPRAVGFAAGRRLGGSVVRNRVRRRLREAYRRRKALAPDEGIRLCFVARRAALTADFATLVQDVGSGLGAATRGGRP